MTTIDISDILKVLLIAASPVSELRGAIPLAILLYGFPWYYAFLFGVLGNLLPVPFLLLFLDSITRALGKVAFISPVIKWVLARALRQSATMERYERIGLALFVAIPMPFTGAWTGSIAAVLLHLKFRYAIISIIIGILIAGVVVTLVAMLGWTLAGIFTAG